MSWIEDKFKPLIARIKQDISNTASLFRTNASVAIPADNDTNATSYEDILIHGNSFLLEKKSDDTGFYIIDPTKPALPIGILNKGVTTPDGTTVHTVVNMASTDNVPTNGESTDVSTAVLVRKVNPDTSSIGYVIAISNEANEPIPRENILFQLLNGNDDFNEEVLNITSDYIQHKVQGDGFESIVGLTGDYVTLWTNDGKLITGESLSGLQTSAKSLVAAINELKGQVESTVPSETNFVPYGKFVIYQSSQYAGSGNTDLQRGDLATGWITPDLWIMGIYEGPTPNDIGSWDIIQEVERAADPGVFGDVFGDEFD